MTNHATGRERWVACISENSFPVRRPQSKAVLTTCCVLVGLLRESIAPDRVCEVAICRLQIAERFNTLTFDETCVVAGSSSHSVLS